MNPGAKRAVAVVTAVLGVGIGAWWAVQQERAGAERDNPPHVEAVDAEAAGEREAGAQTANRTVQTAAEQAAMTRQHPEGKDDRPEVREEGVNVDEVESTSPFKQTGNNPGPMDPDEIQARMPREESN